MARGDAPRLQFPRQRADRSHRRRRAVLAKLRTHRLLVERGADRRAERPQHTRGRRGWAGGSLWPRAPRRGTCQGLRVRARARLPERLALDGAAIAGDGACGRGLRVLFDAMEASLLTTG